MEETIRAEVGTISWQFSKHVVAKILVIILGIALLMEQFFPEIVEWFPGKEQIMEAEYGEATEGKIEGADPEGNKISSEVPGDIVLKKVLLKDDPASDMLLLEKDASDKNLVLPDVSDGNLWEANQREASIAERDGVEAEIIIQNEPADNIGITNPIVEENIFENSDEQENLLGGKAVIAPTIPEIPSGDRGIVEPAIPETPSGEAVAHPPVPDIPLGDEAIVNPIMPDTPSADGEVVAPIVPDIPSVGGEVVAPIVPDIPSVGGEVADPTVPDTPIEGEIVDPAVPDTPTGGEIVEPVVSDTPTGGEAVEPAVPDTGEEGNSGEQKPVSAFLLDEMGMLYGFLPEYAEIPDGCLTLPAECTGIRQGTFSGCGAGILELYIPVGAVTIEEGALSDLISLEWIDVEEGNYAYTSNDGVLFDSTMSVLLAFPPGWLDIYSVPPCVTRIADRAFDGTSIYKLDIRRCTDLSFGNYAFGSSGGSGIQVAARESEMEMYAERLAGYAVTLTK